MKARKLATGIYVAFTFLNEKWFIRKSGPDALGHTWLTFPNVEDAGERAVKFARLKDAISYVEGKGK